MLDTDNIPTANPDEYLTEVTTAENILTTPIIPVLHTDTSTNVQLYDPSEEEQHNKTTTESSVNHTTTKINSDVTSPRTTDNQSSQSQTNEVITTRTTSTNDETTNPTYETTSQRNTISTGNLRYSTTTKRHINTATSLITSPAIGRNFDTGNTFNDDVSNAQVDFVTNHSLESLYVIIPILCVLLLGYAGYKNKHHLVGDGVLFNSCLRDSEKRTEPEKTIENPIVSEDIVLTRQNRQMILITPSHRKAVDSEPRKNGSAKPTV